MTDSCGHHKSSSSAASTSLSYPVRRMRNTAVLVKWIEEHQSNPYPTKAEKQYLAYYSGMNLTQLSTWFANARRRIKKIGMKTWLEGRSTFSLDYIPSPLQRSSLSSESYGSGYHGLSSAATSPYAAAAAAAASYSPLATAGFPGTYTHQHSGSLGMSGTSHLHNGMSGYDAATAIQPSTASTSPLGGLYGMSTAGQCRNSMMAFSGMSGLSTMGQWPTTPILSSNHGSFSSFQSRPTSNSTGPLHSPLTAQVYSADTTGTNQLRTHSAQSIDVGDSTYALQQQSPEPLLPECASTEPVNASE